MVASQGAWTRRAKARNRENAKERRRGERAAAETTARDLVTVSEAASDPFSYYSSQRRGHRRFTIHVGPTNSGKTHDALEALKHAGSGAYLAPLRLLALETGERLRAEGLPTDIITGEERSLDGDGRFVSQTIATLSLGREYACVVIDEAQMIADPEHGGAWTRAILGVDCPEIHVCCAPEALKIVESLIAMCGDEMEVARHERSTPLTVESEPWDGRPRPGDAVIAFNRRDVLRTAAEIEEDGIPTAVVYGALPWAARRAEAMRFASGAAQVLVATDAIGMGMNLPIRRIVFGANRKYDGTRQRPLDAVEVRQIAGRAGRLGMFDEGLVTSDAMSNAWLTKCLTGPVAPIGTARLPFPLELGSDEQAPLTTILKVWANAPTRSGLFERERLGGRRAVSARLEAIAGARSAFPYDRRTILSMAFLPVDERRDMDELVALLKGLAQSRHPMLPGGVEWRSRFTTEPDRLGALEHDIRILTLRYSFANALGLMDETMDERFAETRARWDRAVIDKVAGPKAPLLGARMYGRAEWDDWDDDEDPYTDGAWRF